MAKSNLLERGQFLHACLSPARLTRIVDIGANPINHNPYDVFLDDGILEVIGFEPQPEAFAKLQSNPKPNRTVFNTAVGDGTTQTLHLYKSDGFSSLLLPNRAFNDYLHRWYAAVREVGRIKVQTQRLDDVPDLPDIDMIKIDIQGSELQVFENGRKTLGAAQVVMTEVAAIQIYKDQPLLDDQMRFLRSVRYDLHKFMFFKQLAIKNAYSDQLERREGRNQLIDGDAVFIRDLLRLENKSDEDLKHLAILAGTVFDSADMVIRILMVLAERDVIPIDSVDKFMKLVLDH